MKRAVKAKTKRTSKRDLFNELREGLNALADARHGKRTLRTHALKLKPTTRRDSLQLKANFGLN
jgi:putative transcriptional regulator